MKAKRFFYLILFYLKCVEENKEEFDKEHVKMKKKKRTIKMCNEGQYLKIKIFKYRTLFIFGVYGKKKFHRGNPKMKGGGRKQMLKISATKVNISIK